MRRALVYKLLSVVHLLCVGSRPPGATECRVVFKVHTDTTELLAIDQLGACDAQWVPGPSMLHKRRQVYHAIHTMSE